MIFSEIWIGCDVLYMGFVLLLYLFNRIFSSFCLFVFLILVDGLLVKSRDKLNISYKIFKVC